MFAAFRRPAVWQMVLALAMLTPAARADITLSSPNSTLTATLSLSSAGHLQYRLQRNGLTVLEDSPLGITIDWNDLGAGVTSMDIVAQSEVDDSYPCRGVKAIATNHYKEYTLQIGRSGTGDAGFRMVWRAYDDAVAFNYQIPGTGNRSVCNEATGWTVPAGTRLWGHDGLTYYEGVHKSYMVGQSPILVVLTPATCELPSGPGLAGGYLAIMEASLTQYEGMMLCTTGTSRTIQSKFWWDYNMHCWTLPAGTSTPWRVSLATATLNELVNSTIIENLNPPPSASLFADSSWIRPGRCVWSWWVNDTRYSDQVPYIDGAVSLGFDYALWDEGWETWTSSQLDTLLNYAKSKNIGVWLWKEYVTLDTPAKRTAFFNWIDAKNASLDKKVIVGAKIDFINSEAMTVLSWYPTVLQEAASHQLMLNFHGANKPTGLSRTWPNEVTREGVRGLEYNIWGDYLPPSHNAALPFTRLLAGHADYTPVTFMSSRLGSTSFAQQLAMAFVLTSPLTHWADTPSRYLSSPAVDVIRAAPTVWDETVVLDGSNIGDLVIFARRNGQRWFLAAVNGSSSARTVPIGLSFLGKSQYNAVLLSDQSTTAAALTRTTQVVGASQLLSPWLRGGGGFVAMFTKIAAMPADFDRDNDVDQEDFAFLQACLAGSNMPIPAGCADADLDADQDIDGADADLLLGCLSGPGSAARADCMTSP